MESSMADRKTEQAAVLSQRQLAAGVYDLWLRVSDETAEAARPGQFVSLYCADASRLLPRPISICEINTDLGALRLVYRVAGAGTKEFSGYKAGDAVRILGPLGNGYNTDTEKSALLIGGGIGIPPMLELAKQLLVEEKTAVLGYANRETFLADEMKKHAKVFIATDDGSVGTHGTVLDAIREQEIRAEVIYACGPTPMLRAVKAYAEEAGIECFLSLEERMACGIGACLGCVCESTQIDGHSHVHNKRICKDGPVFRAEDVQL